jgi:hypothetical protein
LRDPARDNPLLEIGHQDEKDLSLRLPVSVLRSLVLLLEYMLAKLQPFSTTLLTSIIILFSATFSFSLVSPFPRSSSGLYLFSMDESCIS